MPQFESFFISLAAGLAQQLLQAAHRKLTRSQDRALNHAYQDGFAHMLFTVAQGRSPAEVGQIAQVYGEFLDQPGVADTFLDFALSSHHVDLDALGYQFQTFDGPTLLQNIPFDFDRSVRALQLGLTQALITEAKQHESPLHNQVSLDVLLDVQRLLTRNLEIESAEKTQRANSGKNLSELKNGQLYMGRFEILGSYGRDGISDVYAAWDRNTNSKVIIKRYMTDQETSRSELYARREANILHKLPHSVPGLVKTHEVLPSSEEICLVQEYISGRSLHTHIQYEGFPDLETSINIVLKIAATLQELHRHKVAHCDVKPLNIIIDQFGDPVLIDLGAARVIGRPISPEEVLVSVPYSPRELYTGEAIDGRSDIYALGMTLMHMLVGLPKINKNRDMTRHPSELIDSPTATEVKQYIDYCLLEVTPETLRAIIKRALAQDPKKRHSDIESLRDDIQSISR